MRLLGNYQSGVRMKTMLVVVFLLLSHGRAFAQVGLLCDFNSVDTLDAVVQSDSVNISNVRLCAYCSATFAVSVTQSSDSLFIVQTDTAGVIATCQCLFDINVAITGLAPGTYSALVYREYLKNYGYQADTVLYVGAVQFTVAMPALQGLSAFAKQSECQPTRVIEFEPDIPGGFSLSQSFPNPFNPVTTIMYQLPIKGNAALKIFDGLGNEIVTLVEGVQERGSYTVNFDASSLASGVYFYQLRTDRFTATKQMLLLR